MQQLINTILSEKYNCIIANNGLEAWKWLEQNSDDVNNIELILSDIMMPEMDGYTFLGKVKEHEKWQKLPMIMLTAMSAERDKLKALRMGVDDYLNKPFSAEELIVRLNNLISNFKIRQNILEESKDNSNKVSFEFEESHSANQIWLTEVENAGKEALELGIKLTTSYLASKVFISERQFSRKIKAYTGLTPNGYIQEIKLQKARHLLENQIYTTVNEVAQAVGYSSGSYLTKMYEASFGKKPGEYL